MKNIYELFEHIESKPALYLGNNYGITALNHFVTGFGWGGGQFYNQKLNFPDFSLFTDWLGGIFNYKQERSSMSWCWMLLKKYKDDKKAFEKFFFYLKQFKAAESEAVIVRLTKDNIQFALEHKANYLWCKVGNLSKSYYGNLKKIDKIVLFQLKPSRTLFTLLLTGNNKVLDTRNSDMTNNILRNKIEDQFGINLENYKSIKSVQSKNILRQHKII